MPVRKTKGKGAAGPGTKVRGRERAATTHAAQAAASEAASAAADLTRAEDEAAGSTAYSALSAEAEQRAVLEMAEGTAALSMADEVSATGELAAALSSDEFRRGMELAGIAGQVQVAAELVRGVGQPTLAAFLGRTSHQLRGLAADALSRATESSIVAHGADHLAGELAALGLTELDQGRGKEATAEALGVASADLAAEAVRSVAKGAADLAATTARRGIRRARPATSSERTPTSPGGVSKPSPAKRTKPTR